jgi:uncharacterized protein (DUF305 family)
MLQQVRCALIVFAASAAFAVPAAAQSAARATPAAARHTAADASFMRGMIGHHAQALVMAAMAATHGASPQVALFARRIIVSQRDEMDMMERWLQDRGEAVPAPAAHAGHAGADDHSMHMPGMLSAGQLASLDRARGTEWDRLFLTYMIQHHEGALVMVQTLFDTPGSGQEAELFGFASGVDADQRAEIARMRAMLKGIRSD